MTRIVLLLIVLLVPVFTGAVEVYRWVEADGVIHYSDRPQEGAELVIIQEAQTFSAPAPQATRSAATATGGKPADGSDGNEASQSYSTFEIVSPKQEEVLWNTGGELSVALRSLRIQGHPDTHLGPLGTRCRGLEHDMQSLLLECTLELSRHASIHPRDNAIEQLDDGHIGPQSAPHGTELETHRASTNDEEPVRDPLERERLGRADDTLPVEGQDFELQKTPAPESRRRSVASSPRSGSSATAPPAR